MAASTTSFGAPIFFWREFEHPYGFLSQWYPSAFTAPHPLPNHPPMTFLTTEQYMMYHKAMLFRDDETAVKIMAATEPRKQKALGRKVKDFTAEVWEQNREKIVEEGNWNKFCHAKEEEGLQQKLMKTGTRELVEASPSDKIWGVGFNAGNAAANREKWGQNLLGKALMRVRERIRKLEKQQL
ncbi:Conserved hypothetical protein CHP02464 [Lasallia pustulata]|uniref:NADAR domain-containing protein n=1 Tax=Lasallia pustulata TaxID=136370 RepID=A0A1W5D4U5_9LECA|nr:Conserved hypothetical protein CHP02464 [Lasallia pustulata]